MRDLVKAAKALSDETRLRILGLLMEKECCVCEVMQALEISQTRASRNLSALYDAGFLKLRKDGLWSVYSLDRGGMGEHLSLLVQAAQSGLEGNQRVAQDRERLRNAVRVGPGCVRPPRSQRREYASMKTVLFVCIGNSGRSQMAEAFFNHLALGRALALSAGTRPGRAINPTVAEAMEEVGISLAGHRPKALTSEMVAQATHVITMGYGADPECPVTFVPAEDWGLEDPKDKPLDTVRQIRDQVRERVQRLLVEMEGQDQLKAAR